MHRRSIVGVVSVLLVASCGTPEEPPAPPEPATPYGSVAQVTEYRAGIEPYIRAVTAAQNLVEQRVGSSGRATPANLAEAMAVARPELESAYLGFRALEPPSGLAALHDKIGRLMACRLDAYRLTIDGWKRQHGASPETMAWQDSAEAKLDEANQLILELNAELRAVDAEVRAAAGQQLATP